MRIVFMGNNPRGVACLQALLNANENVVGVVAHPDAKQGIGGDILVKDVALEWGTPLFQPENVNAPEFVEKLRVLEPDLIIMAGYNQIVKKQVIEIPPQGCINLHGGKLPDYRGTAPLNWAIINGETKGGLAIIFVDEGIDTGDIIRQAEFEIAETDTIADVIQKTIEIFPPMLLEVVNDIRNGTVTRTRQNPEEGAYYTRRYPRDGRIHWDRMTAKQVYDLVRALVRPYPGAFTYVGERKLLIWKVSIPKMVIKGVPGRAALRQRDGVIVIAKDRGVLVEKVEWANGEAVSPKKALPLKETLI